MPARDGSGPLGQGPRSGRGMGNCSPGAGSSVQAVSPTLRQPFGWGGRMWDATLGRFFRRRRGPRMNQR